MCYTSKVIGPKAHNIIYINKGLLRCEHLRPGLLELFIVICWGIWKNINDLQTGGKGKASRSILRNASQLVEEYRAANEPKTEHLPEPPASVSWSLPSHGHYKVNIDGAIFSKRKQAGAGVIIKDGVGHVMAALSKRWNYSLGTIEAKAKVWEVGVLFARDMGIRDAEFKGDSLVVCNVLQGLASLPTSVANVLIGFLNHASLFMQWKVSHIKRQGNVLLIY